MLLPKAAELLERVKRIMENPEHKITAWGMTNGDDRISYRMTVDLGRDWVILEVSELKVGSES